MNEATVETGVTFEPQGAGAGAAGTSTAARVLVDALAGATAPTTFDGIAMLATGSAGGASSCATCQTKKAAIRTARMVAPRIFASQPRDLAEATLRRRINHIMAHRWPLPQVL